jgi:hypothetical protein
VTVLALDLPCNLICRPTTRDRTLQHHQPVRGHCIWYIRSHWTTGIERVQYGATRAGTGASNNEHRPTAPRITRKSNRGPSDNRRNECFQHSQIRHEWFQPCIGPVLIHDGYTRDPRFQLMRMGTPPTGGNHTSPSVQRQRLAPFHQ